MRVAEVWASMAGAAFQGGGGAADVEAAACKPPLPVRGMRA